MFQNCTKCLQAASFGWAVAGDLDRRLVADTLTLERRMADGVWRSSSPPSRTWPEGLRQ